jgi:ribosomal-protein-alanine N-acetyltransferase
MQSDPAPAPVSVIPLDLRQLMALEVDALRLDGMRVAVGALPPRFILEAAERALREGKPSVWFSPYAFIDTRPEQIVGTGGFKGSPVDRRVEIGYGVAEEVRGKGIATAAVRALLEVAFSDPVVMEVYAETATANAPSRRVVEKAGFCHVGQRATEADGIVDRWLKSRSHQDATIGAP